MAKAITDVALIGLGAVGAAYLTSVADNFPECRIRVIAAGERAARLRAGGIIYNGRRYMFDVAEPQDGTPAGLLFVSVKNGQLSEAVGQAAAFVGPDTVIISPLNGVTSERKLAERFGAENVVYSYAIKLDATRRGAETVCGNEGWIVFGDARNEPGRLSDNVLAVEEFFKRSRIEYEIPEDMIKSLWKKFMMNCGLNQTSAVLGFMLDAIGFKEGSPTQTAEVSAGLGWIMCIGVILAIGIGLFIFTRCKMTRADVQRAMDGLERQENKNIEVSATETEVSDIDTEQ